MLRVLMLFAVLFLAPFTDTVAQKQWLQPGRRVRLSSPSTDLHNAVATVLWLHGDTVVVRSGGFRVNGHGHRLTDTTVTSVPLAAITELAVQRGTRSNTGTGAAMGLGVGALVGVGLAVATSASEKECSSDAMFCWETTGADYAGGVVAIALLGGALGAIVGAVTKTDKWEEVPLDHLQVSIAPTRNGLGIGARIAF